MRAPGRPPAAVPRAQQGIALITAMLVVTVATVTVVAMVADEHLWLRQVENTIHGGQARTYTLAVEAWAEQLLTDDLTRGRVDHLNEPWAAVIPLLDVEGGVVWGAMEDLQGRINLNNVFSGAPSEADITVFRRLLQLLQIDVALLDAVVDWVDGDLEPTLPHGAEDGAYLGAEVPYRSANAPFASVSELRLVQGFDQQTFARLEPYVSALPERVPVNVNTASIPVLRALFEGLGETEARTLVDGRGTEGYASVDQVLSQPAVRGRAVESELLAVGSRYFRVDAFARVGRGEARMSSVLGRPANAPVRVHQRAWAIGP
jgi:general secretion pathway protein K